MPSAPKTAVPYDRNGTGLAKGFMRFPTARQFRVSSNS